MICVLLSPIMRPTAKAAVFNGAEAPQVVQLVSGNPLHRNLPTALPTLLRHINDKTTAIFYPDPLFIESFEDARIFRHPIIYVNFGDRHDWELSAIERNNLRDYLERGGFLYIDAGIASEFLLGDSAMGQQHSFADWRIHPLLEKLFADIFPGHAFERVPRADPLFRIFHAGLPSPDNLPDTVRDYVVNEKWPEGTFSFLRLKVNGRTAVLASPIVAMGWGRNHLGAWSNRIAFRVRESGYGLDEQLREAAYRGERFEAVREDGLIDVIFCQEPGRPAWVQEPNDRWRIFRYYYTSEISDYAHNFYTQLGVNVFLYALMH